MSKRERLIIAVLFCLLVIFAAGIFLVVTYRDPVFDSVRATRIFEAGLTAVAP